MQNLNMNIPNLKALEQLVWKSLQETFSKVMETTLEEMDQMIMENRDKKRYRLLDSNTVSMDSLFGPIEVKRRYYKDRQKGEYVYLLDQYMEFNGEKDFSPLVEETAIELAVTGTSYRKASEAFETLLGYRVISHEAIRQHLLTVEAIPKEKEKVYRPVLFVEVDGLYTKRQGKGRKGKETKIAAVHQGWELNGKRTRLKGKRHFIHKGKEPFWEAFETFIMETFDYDPLVHRLVINGDGAPWITACQDYFGDRAFFSLDRFHVARDIRIIFREHPRYRAIRKALASYDGDTLLLELNSAVGTVMEGKEEALEELINHLETHRKALGDYRNWLKYQGVDTTDMRPMGSAEGTMSVFAKRMKNGRSWVDKGASAMFTALVAYHDKLAIRTMMGRMEKWNLTKEKRIAKSYQKRVRTAVTEATRGNLPLLSQKANIPIHHALKGLAGF